MLSRGSLRLRLQNETDPMHEHAYIWKGDDSAFSIPERTSCLFETALQLCVTATSWGFPLDSGLLNPPTPFQHEVMLMGSYEDMDVRLCMS